MTLSADRDEARFSRPRHLTGVELVEVAYRHRSFPQHSHAEYVVGVVTAGAEILTVREHPHLAAAGSVLRLHPGEPHANRTLGDDLLRYRVLYLPTGLVRGYLDPDAAPELRFDAPVIYDRTLFEAVEEAHAALSADDAGPLEQQSALAALVARLAEAPGASSPRPDRAQPAAIERARGYIDEHFAEGFDLDTLAAAAGLSSFHLVRSFKKAVGLSPLAYRNQKRVMEARSRLLAGEPIAQVALDMGYADQSHLTRQFQRIVGISPGRYAQQ